jgi:alpha-ketoglutaric semialdehyde dehydrogenase
VETRSQAEYPATLLAAGAGCSESFSRCSPADRNDVVTVAPECDEAAAGKACARAHEAQRDWARVPVPERASLVSRLARLLEREAESLARFVAREVGLPIRLARREAREGVVILESTAGAARRLGGETAASSVRDRELRTYPRPWGVIGLMTSGVAPVTVPLRHLAAAIAHGNAVVWKPSEDAPGTAALLAELWRAAGLPEGALGVVYGSARAGAGLLDQAEAGGVERFCFSGSTEVGRQVGERCGRALCPTTLEVGSKNTLVILADADLELAVDSALQGAFAGAGQLPFSTANVIVDRRVMPSVRQQLQARARVLRVGHPLDESADYGPFVNERFMQQWLGQRVAGLEEGAELLVDGRRIATEPLERGLYATARIFDRVRVAMRVARDECPGPTVNLIEADGLEEAIALATSSPLGFASSIHTRDAKATLRFREAVGATVVCVNRSTVGTEAQVVPESYSRWQALDVDLSGRLAEPPAREPSATEPLGVPWRALGSEP